MSDTLATEVQNERSWIRFVPSQTNRTVRERRGIDTEGSAGRGEAHKGKVATKGVTIAPKNKIKVRERG